MKKIKLVSLVLLTLVIFSCSSNDDDSNSGSIVGTWKPIKEVDVCSTGSEEFSYFDSCQQKGRYTFYENGTLSFTQFDLSNITNNCEMYYEATGTWSLNGDNLTTIINGKTSNPTFFKLKGDILQFGYYDADPYDTCDGGKLPSHYYTEFVRK